MRFTQVWRSRTHHFLIHVFYIYLLLTVCCSDFKHYYFTVGRPDETNLSVLFFDRMQRKVLHQFVMMAKRQMPSRIGEHAGAEDKAAQEGSKRLS